ncbi:short-chain dehydrogenase/oxidoreductase [Viridothelium virens]|uniref:Short-chain dehydrogenase/oxidoreductase n=1 Tax=Viridothelium virens TaxID=1048519 RepID=A0A6A6H138_VIRVR|nr:short-chain dehydrogenase/oxidoreductase [Viridothelium virens]
MSGFLYKKVLIFGATSGIGAAMAERFLENNISVIITGRRKENLDTFVSKYSSSRSSSATITAHVFDVNDRTTVPSFVSQITREHPDLDCVFLNSGMQRSFNFANPTSVDFNLLESELDTNYTSFVRLTLAFTPFLQQQSTPTALIYTSSGLALAPSQRCPNYCATKAAMHSWLLVLRDQLAAPPSPAHPINVIELFPPAVQTELHDAKHQPDIKDGGKMGMPLAEFVDETWSQLSAGKDQIPVGMSKSHFERDGKEGWEVQRQNIYRAMAEGMRKAGL